jgi:hypothetical protein
MDLRDEFAAAALTGLLAQVATDSDGDAIPVYGGGKEDRELLAKATYRIADAMLVARGDLDFLAGYVRAALAERATREKEP